MPVQKTPGSNNSILLGPCLSGKFLQSKLWGEVQKADHTRVFYIENCLIIKHSLPFGKSWFYSPRQNITNEKEFNAIAHKVAGLAKQEKAIFWKVEGIQNNFQIFNFQFSKGQPLQYSETFLVDLTQTEEKLLKNMKQKTRYNIGLARTKGISVRWSKNLEDIPLFYELLCETAKRQKFGIHNLQHYKFFSISRK